MNPIQVLFHHYHGSFPSSYRTIQPTKFPGGEVHVVLPSDSDVRYATVREVVVKAHLHSSDDIMALMVLTDALRRTLVDHTNRKLPYMELQIPYLPYARQDRVTSPGTACSLAVMAQMINSLNYNSVVVFDPHSYVAEALINNMTSADLDTLLRISVPYEVYTSSVLVSPDIGAMKKVAQLGDLYTLPVVCAVKTRDPVTGILSNPRLLDPLPNPHQDVLIVDDILDGGRTFTQLVPLLRAHTTGKIRLYVTHGIFSNGFDDLRCLDNIYVAYSFRKQLPDFITSSLS